MADESRTTGFMARALALAMHARGRTSPNPAVGAVVVKDGRVVGEGYTQPVGQAHAERVALREAGEAASGATLYVTLEPCCHQGRTGPCTEAIIAAGVAEVHYATLDPNPQVSGRGIRRLEAAGIRTVGGELAGEARAVVEGFAKFIKTGRPFVVAKYAMTLDGKIATRTGDSRWISSHESRRWVHQLRDQMDAVMVGIGTALCDDPQLTCRGTRNGAAPERQPVRVVVDSRLRLSPAARMLGEPGMTIVATTGRAIDSAEGCVAKLAARGAAVAMLPADEDGGVDLSALLDYLGEIGLVNILVEGGSALLGSLFGRDLVDKLHAFVAPAIAGGASAPSPAGGKGVERMCDARRLHRVTTTLIGGDILITGYLREIEWPAPRETGRELTSAEC